MPLSRPGLRVEALEARDVPTAMGSPWPNPEALTLSFAADGTRVSDHASDTAAAFGGLPDAVWQREVLRAFQTWAVHTNANIAVVADGGAAFGTPGRAPGDFRFGDVRVGAVPLSGDSLANVSGFDCRPARGPATCCSTPAPTSPPPPDPPPSWFYTF